ncbi:ABC transporter ATP-binding protein [Marivibrio halodurans]|uniref:ABC transporter ATP-binding protein n=1 Tax=Marivibrio halodurans TaxID=2039722 RepID=A0A8J7SJ40_9PROT|nr:ABC transporter ATP-binding protein [Marivibrio halodurans]MBP5855423.1 ABC transporter ATP-binding protein [Marivibrio halodurans]
MSDAAIILEARDVQKRFGAVVAAQDINIKVGLGEKLSLIGANGAGKTTFMNIVTGYLKPDAGSIHFDGLDVTKLNPRQLTRRGVCRSFQIPQLYEPMTALENLLVAIGTSNQAFSLLRPARDAAVLDQGHALLKRFGLEGYAERKVSELPGGVRKLLDIAMALVRRPKVLLLDEPTSGVSVDEKFPLMETVMEALSEEEVTVIFVEHDMEIVTRYSDRVLAFYQGQVIADDDPGEVLADKAVQKYVTGTAKADAVEEEAGA